MTPAYDSLDEHIDASGLHGATDALPGLDDAELLPNGERQAGVLGQRRRQRSQHAGPLGDPGTPPAGPATHLREKSETVRTDPVPA